MHKLWPYFQPVHNAREAYAHTVELFHAAEAMKKFGVRVDLRRIAHHISDAKERVELFTKLFLHHTGLSQAALGPSGAGQTDSVKAWFKKAGAPDVAFDKHKRPQFNATALTTWAKDYPGQTFSQPAAALLGLRKAKSALGFLNSYYDVGDRHGGRIHFGFNPLGTKTGRWSASQSFSWIDMQGELVQHRLNAQNVPSKDIRFTFDSEGELPIMVSLRDCFIPDTGCVWVKADYEALEARLIAYITGAPKLIEWITTGKDLHVEHARALFTEAMLPPFTKADKQFKVFREAAKPIVYALTYQAPSERGADKYPTLFKSLKQAFPQMDERYFKSIVRRFFELHPTIRAWQNEVGRALKNTGSIFIEQSGRRLYYPPSMRGRNQAQNLAFQSGGAALINRALRKLYPQTRFVAQGTAILLQVHDELSFQVAETEVDSYCALIEETMSEPMQFGKLMQGVPAAADVGDDWGNTHERPTA